MGGHTAGDIASETVIEALRQEIEQVTVDHSLIQEIV